MNDGPLKLGVTGGIGSGKTSVCRVFSVLGIPVFSTDLVAREIMDSDVSVREKISIIAGTDIYPEGNLDRNKLASLIFNDESKLGKVNSIVHPLVFSNFREWSAKQESPYVIMEAAILFEGGADKYVDLIATVVAPAEEKIQRVMSRSNLSREQVLERMKNQMEDDERIGRSDYIIKNSENDMIIPAIIEIHNDILIQLNL